MYTVRNFRTKKALKEAVAAGEEVMVFQPNDMFGVTDRVYKAERDNVTLEGPHYPEPHRWYAQAVTSFGKIVSVR